MTLQTKMIAITIGALFLALVAIVPSMRTLWVKAEENTTSILQSSLSNLVKRSVDGLYPQMQQALPSINRNRKLKKAIVKGDRKAVEENVVTSYRRLSATNLIDNLEILSKDGERLYSSSGSSGTVRHSVASLVREQNKNIEGLSLDDRGKLFAFLGFPITNRGKLVGIALLAKDISETLKQTAAIDQSQIFVADERKKILSQSEEVDVSDIELPVLGEAHIDDIAVGDRIKEVNIVPLMDLQFKAIGHLIHIQDITEKHKEQQSLFIFNMGLLTILFLIIIFFLRWFIKKEFKGLDQAVEVQNQISNGDLHIEINNDRSDEIGRLLDSADSMAQKLRTTVSQVVDSASQINMASDEFLTITDKTNQGMKKQQSSIEDLLAAVTQMSATVHEINQNTNDAADKAKEMANIASDGKQKANISIQSINTLSDAVKQASLAISNIEEESHNISTILESIKGIAEQTNLLALNAAIEAARAGEQGRGFAVVADEVRTLAQRTHDSTGEVEAIISNLSKCTQDAVNAMEICNAETGNSVEQVQVVDRALETISEGVGNISEMSQHISHATREQATVAENINSNVVIISDIANTTLENSEQTHNTSKDLASMSTNLKAAISVFHTE